MLRKLNVSMKNYSLLAILLMIAVSVNHSKKPYSKRQQSIWRLECELGVVTDAECPVDGGWSPWSSWSVCHGPCDDIGHRRRQRQCDNPPPSPDGLPCSGLAEQIENCHLTNCTVDDFRKLVEGDAVRIRALQQLEAVPALMERCLEMECPFEAIEAALATDNTWNLKAESLWNALHCVKHNLGCPVLGEWGAWSEWSSCGARCGSGLRWRLRRCDNPPPSDAHLVCSDTPLQARGCEGDQCATDPLDSIEEKEGIWSEWTDWSPCSVKCGTGVRRRRRTCMEIYKQHLLGVWGTHCKGQYNQIEVCYNKECVLDGGWSGWSAWGPCSQSCGAGRRSRTRSCTRPIPAGDGQNCVGPRTEVGSCYHMPCEIYQHTVAVLNGDSHLKFEFQNKRSRLFHFYVRFMPLSPHGTLVRRGTINSPHIRLSLQKWHVCLDASGSSHPCALPRICTTDVIEPAIWHSAMITVTSEAATLRFDDSHIAFKSSFPCDPEFPNDVVNIYVGERLHGEIQELILNFIPLNIMIDRERKIRKSDFYPTHVSNVAYEKSNIEEAFLSLDNEHYLRLPCFESQDQWTLHLTVKSNRDSGTILFLRDEQSGSWFYMALQNMRLKLKLAMNEFRAEGCSSSEYPLDQWLDLQLSKKKESNTIEALINSEEHLHILFSEDYSTDRQKSRNLNIQQNHTHFKSHPDNDSDITEEEHSHYSICNDEFFVGGIPNDVKSSISEDLTPFMGLIALLSIDQALLDLRNCNMERYKEGKVQVSSRTASVSGSYHETAWGNSNSLNLTCLHTRSVRTPHSAHWLFLDVAITSALKDKKVRSVDDGRVLRLMATADNDLRGFYTCRAHSNKRTRNIVTYGVLGKVQYQLTEPDLTTFVAVITTVSLVIATLLWLFVEGIHDLRNGYGFFRDAHLSPEEEADAVCKFIDDNSNLIGSHSEEMLAKARARRKAQHLASKNSFGAQEPQGLLMEQDFSNENKDDSSASEPDGLPALPEVVSSVTEQSQKILRCEPCYVSSPRLCSKMSSARSKLTSSSAGDSSSPRYLCSRLLLTRRFQSSRESFLMRRSKTQRGGSPNSPRKTRSNLLTIKSSTLVNLSPGQRILQKFKQLKSNDTSD